MARIIQLRPQGGTKRRYGSFAGRVAFAVAVGAARRKAVWRYEERDITEQYEPEQRKERLKLVKKPATQNKIPALDIIPPGSVVYAPDTLLQAHRSLGKLLEPPVKYERAVDVLALRKARDEDDILMLMDL